MYPDSNPPTLIDPRGPRFAAVIASILLITSLIAGPTLGLPVLIIQLTVYASGSLLGLRQQPYHWLFLRLARPRMPRPQRLINERLPRFTYSLSLGLIAVAALGSAMGVPLAFYLATAVTAGAALIHAATNFSVGDQLFLLGQRVIRLREVGAQQ